MKTMRFIAMIMAAAMLFASCEKTINPGPDEPTPQPQPQPEPEVMQLAGTSWESSFSNTYSYMNTIDMEVNAYFTLDFLNETDCEMFTDFALSVPSMPSMNMASDTTESFTYTFDGTTLTMTYEEEGDMGTMTYHPEDTTFVMIIPDETYQGINTRELYGSDRMIFRKVR